jgi:hypothetical protein
MSPKNVNRYWRFYPIFTAGPTARSVGTAGWLESSRADLTQPLPNRSGKQSISFLGIIVIGFARPELSFSGACRKILRRSHFPEKGLEGAFTQKASTNAAVAVIWEDSIQDAKAMG